jgi:deoxycytidylate deaminase
MIINAGINQIVYEEGYADSLAGKMLKESGIKIEKVSRKLKGEGETSTLKSRGSLVERNRPK